MDVNRKYPKWCTEDKKNGEKWVHVTGGVQSAFTILKLEYQKRGGNATEATFEAKMTRKVPQIQEAHILIKLNLELPHNSAVPLLVIYPKELRTSILWIVKGFF